MNELAVASYERELRAISEARRELGKSVHNLTTVNEIRTELARIKEKWRQLDKKEAKLRARLERLS